MYRIDQRDTEAFGLPASICYTFSFERAERHLLGLRIEAETRGEDALEFVLPTWTPGSYKVREFSTHFTVENALDERGRMLEVEWRAKNRFRVFCPGAQKLYLKAVYFANERSVRTTHVNRWSAFIMPSTCCPYVEGRLQEPCHVVVEHDPARWPRVTTPLAPVDIGFPPRFGAVTYDVLADSPLQVGSHRVAAFTVGDRLHEVAIVSDEPVDEEWLLRAAEQVVRVTAAFWGGELPYDRYVFFFHFVPNGSGGLEHARAHVLAVDPAALREIAGVHRFLRLLCHEFFHTWNGKRIRPVGLGPFDYERELYTPLLWLVEGVTSYYEVMLAYWCGFLTRRELLAHLGWEVEQLSHVPGRYYLSVRDSSILAWVKLYARSPDGPNRFPSYYLKGAQIAWLLDAWIIAQTQGQKRLQDGLQELWRWTRQQPERGWTEEEIVAALEAGTGVGLKEPLMEWLIGRGELPYEEVLPAIGLRLSWTRGSEQDRLVGERSVFGRIPTARFTGLTLRQEDGSVVVEAVEEFSPAAAAGIAVGDELIAVNGIRLRTPGQLEAFLGMAEGPVEILAASDGRLYTTQLSSEPRCRPQLEVVATEGSPQFRLLETWLRKPLLEPQLSEAVPFALWSPWGSE
ncbi:MAG: PDZ domain-containing protein [Candidatus Kapabacteria bacterium]|nr:PDZ domain-containing protein [Candidatus Kapabacteria bacterium]MDW8012147.1 PDZ domain-containing protein [Bacteroidota bacterium]